MPEGPVDDDRATYRSPTVVLPVLPMRVCWRRVVSARDSTPDGRRPPPRDAAWRRCPAAAAGTRPRWLPGSVSRRRARGGRWVAVGDAQLDVTVDQVVLDHLQHLQLLRPRRRPGEPLSDGTGRHAMSTTMNRPAALSVSRAPTRPPLAAGVSETVMIRKVAAKAAAAGVIATMNRRGAPRRAWSLHVRRGRPGRRDPGPDWCSVHARALIDECVWALWCVSERPACG